MRKHLRSFGTHDGSFHGDEVTACALLLLFDCVDRDKIVRTRNLEQLKTCEYVCDVGGVYDPQLKMFDHHQVDYQGNLSSAGMILLYLKDQGILSPGAYEYFNNTLILGVDAHDNGKDPQIPGIYTYSHIISSFNPIIRDVLPQEMEETFSAALDFAYQLLDRLWRMFQYAQSCREVVERVMQESQECLVFDQNIPWMDSFFELGGLNHPAQFLIMPSGMHWKLRGIPPTMENRMQVRMPLPEEWAGLANQDLQRVTGIPGAIFCHKGRFISVWKTREDALQALDIVLKRKNRR